MKSEDDVVRDLDHSSCAYHDAYKSQFIVDSLILRKSQKSSRCLLKLHFYARSLRVVTL